jgi:hypothetical protein
MHHIHTGLVREHPSDFKISWLLEAVRAVVIRRVLMIYEVRRFVAPFINKLPATNKRVGEIIAPEIERRRKLMNEYGKDYPDKNVGIPLDVLDEMLIGLEE